ncbi:longitudinals lacking protein isoform X11 [Nilaparvata lugens]|uniref:longitudinals lacking protein isoform X11 n=1 Tax=Nilaparvata lugens TaxID=108931 RepID=UPI00193CC513|nr:longitudinals lacking protein isoform X11 [Nilaparvata lugens]
MLLKGGDSPAAQWCNVECTAQIRARSGGRIPFCEANTTRRRPTVTLIAKLATVIIDASNFKAGECITAPNSSDKMAADQQFCLRWNNHQSTLIQVFDTLLASEQLVDCTLAAEGQYLKAHKVVLSACSPYLELLLAQHYEKHPIVILKDVKFQELKSMMDYMYRGEVNISQDQLSTFLKAAESLQIKGLTDSGEDSRDVGSTKRVDGAAQGARKAAAATGAAAASSGSNRASPAVGGTGLTIEPRPASPHHRDASLSPTPRKRRRARRPSQGDAPDSHNDTSNSCDLPPASALAPPEQHIETEHINNRLQNSNNMELIKEKVEPTPELMIEPKTEYMDENNEDSVEDLTLDDDDDLDMNRSGMDMGRPGPSHGDSNQGFATSWHMQGDRSGTDEVFMAAQEAVGAAHRDSQGSYGKDVLYYFDNSDSSLNKDKCECLTCGKYYKDQKMLIWHQRYDCSIGLNVTLKEVYVDGEVRYQCDSCDKCYKNRGTLLHHLKHECGKTPQFECTACNYNTKRKSNLKRHFVIVHNDILSPELGNFK